MRTEHSDSIISDDEPFAPWVNIYPDHNDTAVQVVVDPGHYWYGKSPAAIIRDFGAIAAAIAEHPDVGRDDVDDLLDGMYLAYRKVRDIVFAQSPHRRWREDMRRAGVAPVTAEDVGEMLDRERGLRADAGPFG